jgi:alkylhydroperoxidase/carboxymuconolactone decarboxylase family protein YurZ
MVRKDANVLIAEIKKRRGYVHPWQLFLAKEDPLFFEGYEMLFEHFMRERTALPTKTKEMLKAVLLSYRGFERPAKMHIQKALREGATKDEFIDAFESVLFVGGAPTLLHGLKALEEVLNETKSASTS